MSNMHLVRSYYTIILLVVNLHLELTDFPPSLFLYPLLNCCVAWNSQIYINMHHNC